MIKEYEKLEKGMAKLISTKKTFKYKSFNIKTDQIAVYAITYDTEPDAGYYPATEDFEVTHESITSSCNCDSGGSMPGDSF